MELRALSLDDLVPAEHRVRLVSLYDAIRSVEGGPGHPPADPRVLTALWLYATVEGAVSYTHLTLPTILLV